MIKISEDRFTNYEQSYPGISEQILRYEAAELPPCANCGSAGTAVVIGALVGRTIHLAAATTRLNLTPNGNSLPLTIAMSASPILIYQDRLQMLAAQIWQGAAWDLKNSGRIETETTWRGHGSKKQTFFSKQRDN